jgi:hypothetical protein
VRPVTEWEEDDLLELIQVGADEDVSTDWKEAGALTKSEGAKNEIGLCTVLK